MQVTEEFVLEGKLGSADLSPWLLRHAGKLGLAIALRVQTDERLEMTLSGAPDLLDAMEMGCLLGPYDIWVDSVARIRSGCRNGG
ncbi:hypothetical protein GCM10011415_41470 [Salipiger pallidus]|uniref:Acylphosphatase n=1 Tax=Salipiger pallidus TaxID=1775170 RepID=A0A8J2ZNK5_9RHOB|nr:acylphosphatase [Salipiger pallidus]GGG86714.1 hypothetical protein GCM10011415_41470 [Salipiger pallidus]